MEIDQKSTLYMNTILKTKLETIFDSVLKRGSYEVLDSRFNRKLVAKNCVYISIEDVSSKDTMLIDIINSEDVHPKYMEDFKYMFHSLLESERETKRDPDSRQIIVSNMDSFQKRKPCFLLIQFISDFKGFYTCIVTQRSLDKVKFYDDLRFFGRIIDHFQKATDSVVTKLDINIGNAHKLVD